MESYYKSSLSRSQLILPLINIRPTKEEGVFGPGMALESQYNGCDLIVSKHEVSVLELVRQRVSLDLAGNWKVKA